MKSEIPPRIVHRSEDYSEGPFRPHGRIEIWIEDEPGGALIYSVAEGPFNPEFIKAFELARNDLVRSREVSKVLGHITQMHTSVMASPDTLEGLHNYLANVRKHGLASGIVAWVVAPDVEGRDLMLPMFERVHTDNGLAFKAFLTLPEAQAWVRSLLAAPSP